MFARVCGRERNSVVHEAALDARADCHVVIAQPRRAQGLVARPDELEPAIDLRIQHIQGRPHFECIVDRARHPRLEGIRRPFGQPVPLLDRQSFVPGQFRPRDLRLEPERALGQVQVELTAEHVVLLRPHDLEGVGCVVRVRPPVARGRNCVVTGVQGGQVEVSSFLLAESELARVEHPRVGAVGRVRDCNRALCPPRSPSQVHVPRVQFDHRAQHRRAGQGVR